MAVKRRRIGAAFSSIKAIKMLQTAFDGKPTALHSSLRLN